MADKILITSTSFFDTQGKHHNFLRDSGLHFEQARGPLTAEQLIEIIKTKGPFKALLCGEDDVNEQVVAALAPDAKVISKYGVGIDRIDVAAAGRAGITVTNTPGVNHRSVAELTFGLLLSLARSIPQHNSRVHNAEWKRHTGVELAGKTLGVVGFGRVGREVAIRAMAFGMNVVAFNSSWPKSQVEFVSDLNNAFAGLAFDNAPRPLFNYLKSVDLLLEQADFISLHMNLTRENLKFLDTQKLLRCKKGVYIVNVSRASLIDTFALVQALKAGHVAGYAADVLDKEPVAKDDPLLGLPNVVLTPHVGSRTVDSVERQGIAALENILKVINPEALNLGSASVSSWGNGGVCVLPKVKRLL